MGVRERIRMCQLVEKMNEHKVCSEKLGLENKSSFRGYQIENIDKKERGNKK